MRISGLSGKRYGVVAQTTQLTIQPNVIPHVHALACHFMLVYVYSIYFNRGFWPFSLGAPFACLAMNRPKAVPQSTMGHMRKGNFLISIQ